MTTPYEIPLTSDPQVFKIALAGTTYGLRVVWNAISAAWVLDISDDQGNPLAQGIPLVTGLDLLAQYRHLQIAGSLIVQTDFSPDAMPTFDNLGATSRLFFVTEP